MFTLGMLCVPLLGLIDYRLAIAAFSSYLLYFLAIAADALRVTRSLRVALLSIPSAFVQMAGYGLGFVKEKLK